MANNWSSGKLSDIAEVIMGQSPPGDSCSNDSQGVPLLNGPTEFGSHHPKAVQYTNDVRKAARKGDILFCVRGSTTGRMNYADQGYAIGRGLAALRHNSGYEYQPFLKAILDYHLPILLGSSTGSTFPNISQEQLKNLEINIPPLETQKEIAHILGTLDDKIELNRKMNKTLEEIAKTLYKHWFIDFEFPNADGKPYKSSGGEMIDSELGPIPKGWRVGPIGDICSFEYGKSLKSPSRNSGKYPVMGSNGQIGWHDGSLVKGPGIVIGRKGNPGIVNWVHRDFYPIDTTFYAVPKTENFSMIFVYYLLLKAELRHLSADSAVPGLNRNAALNMLIIQPSHKMISTFSKQTESSIERCRCNEAQYGVLSLIRDSVYPKVFG